MSTLYENIIALCNERGIKGGKMCTDLGISKGLLTDLKMGRRSGVSAKTADKIASYFGVTVGYLLGTDTVIEPTGNAQPDLVLKYNQLTPEGQKEVLAFIEFKQAQEATIAARGGKVVKEPSPVSAETLDELVKATEEAAKKENDQF